MSANGTSTSRPGWASAVLLHHRMAARAHRAFQTRPEYRLVSQPEMPMSMRKQGTTCGHAMPWCAYDATSGHRRRHLAWSTIIHATYDAPPTRPASHRMRTTLCTAAMTTIPPSTFRIIPCGRLVVSALAELRELERPMRPHAPTPYPLASSSFPRGPYVCARVVRTRHVISLPSLSHSRSLLHAMQKRACVTSLNRPNAKRAPCGEPWERL